ncbi:MAG: PilZ domain-containing protein [Deltaproteobacteria bacterium]|nr:PilZ domain-containing protein [Deltaproteobacteria bacterium]
MKKYERDEIFSGIRQVDWHIGGQKIQHPVFFRDVSSFGALLPARISCLRQLLPDIRFSPARILPGIGLISINAVEFRDMAFNDLSIAIVLNNPGMTKIPGYNLLRQAMQFNTYIYILYQLVNSDNASLLLSGWSDIPSPVVSMALSHQPGILSCEARQDEELILSLRGNKIQAGRSDLMKCFCHYYENGQPQSWEFKVNALEYGFSVSPGDFELNIGTSHPIAREISDIIISPKALLYTYVPCAQAVLYGPEHLQVSNLKYMLQERLGFQMAHTLHEFGKIPERRLHSRNRVNLQAEIVGTKKGDTLHEAVHVVNLSRGGMYVESAVPLDVGNDVSANIEEMQRYNTFWVKGKVVRNEQHSMAIQFIRSTFDEDEDLEFH